MTLAWEPPSSGSDPTGYGYRYKEGSGAFSDSTAVGGGASARSVTVTGLANGTEHTFEVWALNATGASSAATTSATPVPSVSIGDATVGEGAGSVVHLRARRNRGDRAHCRAERSGARRGRDLLAACCEGDDFLREHPVGVEWWGGQFAPCETPGDAAIVRAAVSAARDLGHGGDELAAVPYGSDLRHFVNAGRTPGVLFGPGDVAGAHREDESIGVSELVDGARAVALTVLRFLG